MRLLKIACCIIFFLIIVSILRPKTTYAQTCSGIFSCGNSVSQCQDAFGNACGTCGVFGSSCSYVWTCQEPVGALDRGCAANITGSTYTCRAYGCGLGGYGGSCLLADYCSGGGTICDSSNCFTRSCTNASGDTCSCYGACSGDSCVTGGIVPGSCPTAPAPTSTPVPTASPSCIYGACSPAGATSGSSDPTGHYVCDGTCWQWVNYGSTPAPTSGPAATPAPTSPPVGGTCPAGQYMYNGYCVGTYVWPTPTPICNSLPYGTGEGTVCYNGASCQQYSDGNCGHIYGSCYACNYGCSGGYCLPGPTAVPTAIPTVAPTAVPTAIPAGCTSSWGAHYIQWCSSGAACWSFDNNTCGTMSGCTTCTYSCSGGNCTGPLPTSAPAPTAVPTAIPPPPAPICYPTYFQFCSGGNLAYYYQDESCYIYPGIAQVCAYGCTGATCNAPPPPSCSGVTANPSTVNAGGTSTLSVTSCTNVNPPFVWNPNCPGATIISQTDTATSSTAAWKAPTCPASVLTCNPQVTANGPGGSNSYSTSITVTATYTVSANVRSVTSVGACTSSSGNPYSGANLNLIGGSVNQNQATNASGVASFTCLLNNSYQLTLQLPAGYSVVGTSVSPGPFSHVGNSGLSFTVNQNQTVTFCIAPINPWFQTNIGDVRFSNLLNPIPAGQYGASDSSNPGIYYSSNSNLSLGNGTVSSKGWGINYEYSYNANTQNRNGTMGYGFLKSKARQDGVTITPLLAGTFDQTPITASGIYESPGDLTINSYTHTNGRRVVILVNGNVTINANTIQIPVGGGLFIVAAKRNITIAKGIGTLTLSSTTANIDGYYTAEGSIVVDGDKCADGTTSDLRLNVGGALIANSLKPFATTGTGTIQNKRSLCINTLTYPSLYVASRPDFLTQLTDFYKVSYTKWQEAQP